MLSCFTIGDADLHQLVKMSVCLKKSDSSLPPAQNPTANFPLKFNEVQNTIQALRGLGLLFSLTAV